jgi:predicted Zn-dependent peptidase
MRPTSLARHDLRLSNGLPVVLVSQPAVHSAVVALYLRVGSRFETAETNGISHFLEHMLFRGTASLPTSHAQSLAFERLGGTLYAATHVDHGEMSVAVPPENLERLLPILGEVALSPRFSSIDVERGIIREEILEDLDEDGRQVDADNLSRALTYPDHPLGFTITGGVDALDRFDEPLLRAHHARHYTAENAVLAVAGRIDDTDAVVRAIERSFGAMARGTRVEASVAPEAQKKARFRYVDNQSSQTELRLAFRAPGDRSPHEPATEMLLRVLDDGMSTRLYERICDRLGLCYDVSAMFESYEDDGVLDIAAETQHERAEQVTKEILGLLRDLATEGPSAEELQKALDRHRWSVEAMQDDPSSVAGFFGLGTLTGLARTPEARHDDLAKVSRDEVRDAAHAIFRPERLTAVAVGVLRDAEQKRLEKLILRGLPG